MTTGKSSEKNQSESPKDFEALKKFAFIRKRLEMAKKKKKKK